ncbi:hypothetical protein J0I05_03135 [Candidatus Saccharibacteria bacterium]|nr:hypothetical protein [Candidatus Saccharibacteria bacterium]
MRPIPPLTHRRFDTSVDDACTHDRYDNQNGHRHDRAEDKRLAGVLIGHGEPPKKPGDATRSSQQHHQAQRANHDVVAGIPNDHRRRSRGISVIRSGVEDFVDRRPALEPSHTYDMNYPQEAHAQHETDPRRNHCLNSHICLSLDVQDRLV